MAPAAKSVSALLDAWLEHIEHLGRSPTTLYGYRRLVAQLPAGFKDQPLGKVTPKLVDDLDRHLGTVGRRKPATVLRFHAVLRAAFAQAERWAGSSAARSTERHRRGCIVTRSARPPSRRCSQSSPRPSSHAARRTRSCSGSWRRPAAAGARSSASSRATSTSTPTP